MPQNINTFEFTCRYPFFGKIYNFRNYCIISGTIQIVKKQKSLKNLHFSRYDLQRWETYTESTHI